MRLIWWIASWFGCGNSPIAPGTAGTAGAMPLRAAMNRLSASEYGVVTTIITLVGVLVSTLAERNSGKKDDGRIVIDEVAGYLITTAGRFPAGREKEALTAGFVFFRIFDILKPRPVRRFEKLPGGIGVMADDIMAGIWALIALRLWLLISPGLKAIAKKSYQKRREALKSDNSITSCRTQV